MGWAVILVVVGALVAIPYVYLTRQEAGGAQTALAVADQANDVAAESALTTAAAVAQSWLATNASLQGFGPAQASTEEPSIAWDAAAAQAGHVSIRGADAASVVLVTQGAAGPLCIAVNGGVLTYGHADAANAAQCAGRAW